MALSEWSSGIYSYCKHTEVLTEANLESIEKFFEQWTKDLETEIKELEKLLKQISGLRGIIVKEHNVDEFLEAYRRYDEVMGYQPGDLDKLSEDDLHESIEAYKNAAAIENEYAAVENQWGQAKDQKVSLGAYLKEIDRSKSRIEELTGPKGWMDTAKTVRGALPPEDTRILEDDTQLICHFNDTLARDGDKPTYLREQIDHYRARFRTMDLQTLSEKWDKARNMQETATMAYREFFQREPIPPAWDEHFGNGDIERKEYEQLKKTFESTFRDIVEEFLENDGYKFDNVFDCVELGHALLPAAFHDNAGSDDLIESVNHYLKKINDTNRELNKRKLQKIRDLLDDVSHEVGNRLTMAKRIDIFLNDKDKEITGGHRVRLKAELSRDYPKQWIDNFQHKLNNDANDLISEEVAQGVSLEEKMIAAFRICAPTAIARPKVEKLLDPNAYLDISFSMESNKGQINKGSSGQSYAGIALLCIARLSIIGARDDRRNPPGIRFMPIDEAEGLGSNYDMLYNIAKEYDYQIISLSINPLGKFQDGQQYIYMLQKNTDSEDDVNYQPYAIFCESDKDRDVRKMAVNSYEQQETNMAASQGAA